MLDLKLAAELIKICAEVNDSKGITLSVDNVECRIYPSTSMSTPDNMPLGTALVVFSGSNDVKDWWYNIKFLKKIGPLNCPVHGGFLDCYNKIWHALRIALKDEPRVMFAGHSQGGALALLAAADFWQKGFDVADTYTFGMPRVASKAFHIAWGATGLALWRIVVGCDGVPRTPDGDNDYHCGTGVFFDAHGKPLRRQPTPIWYAPWRYLWDSIDDHLPAYEYSRALDKAASAVDM